MQIGHLSTKASSILLACFFLSGATGLIYEVLWVRLLALTFGNTVFAIGVVLTAFMSGLSLGSYIIGKWSDRSGNPVKSYSLLEFGIAASALATPFLFDAVSSYYRSLSVTTLPLGMLSIIRYLLSMVILIVPTTLMGGTLPLLTRVFVRSRAELESRVGALYALNTLGGVIGTALVGFFLIKYYGLTRTLQAAAAVNVMIGAIAWSTGRDLAQDTASPPPALDVEPLGERAPGYRYALTAFFLSGCAAMIYEIAWNRLLVGVIGSTTYSFSIILACFLIGISLGSFLVARLSKRRVFGLVHFSWLQLVLGMLGLATIMTFGLLPSVMHWGLNQFSASYSGVLLFQVGIVLAYLILPTTLFGATFPVIAAAYGGDKRGMGRSIGTIYAANTVGAILGSAAGSFLLLPTIGSVASIRAAAAINIGLGITGLFLFGTRRIAAASLAVLLLPLLPARIADENLVSGVAVYGNRSDYKLQSDDQSYLYLREGLNATIAVTTNEDGSITLSTNGKADASTGDDMRTQLALAYFPLLLHEEPHDVFVVGYGSGVTVKAAADLSTVRTIDFVEIEPAVMEASRFFENVNRGIDRRSGVTAIVEDARTYLAVVRKGYDVIISEPSNPWISGIGSLFSRDFYEIARAKLRAGGVFCQWVQLYGLRYEDLQMIMKTFTSVFPHTTIWQSNGADIMLIGFERPPGAFAYEKFQGRLSSEPLVASGLKAYLSVFDALDLFSYYVTGEEGVRAIAGNALMNSDDLPLLEFSAPFSLYAATDRKNNEQLAHHSALPQMSGLPAHLRGDDLLFRKALNFAKMDVPLDAAWLSSLSGRKRSYPLQRMTALTAPPQARAAALRSALDVRNLDLDRTYYDLDLAGLLLDQAIADKQLDQARRIVEQAETFPLNGIKHGNLFYRYGSALRQAGEQGKAVAYFHKAVGANPHSRVSHEALGDAYAGKDQQGKACAFYTDAVNLSGSANRSDMEKKRARACAGR